MNAARPWVVLDGDDVREARPRPPGRLRDTDRVARMATPRAEHGIVGVAAPGGHDKVEFEVALSAHARDSSSDGLNRITSWRRPLT